jgi:hypothetical protein
MNRHAEKSGWVGPFYCEAVSSCSKRRGPKPRDQSPDGSIRAKTGIGSSPVGSAKIPSMSGFRVETLSITTPRYPRRLGMTDSPENALSIGKLVAIVMTSPMSFGSVMRKTGSGRPEKTDMDTRSASTFVSAPAAPQMVPKPTSRATTPRTLCIFAGRRMKITTEPNANPPKN